MCLIYIVSMNSITISKADIIMDNFAVLYTEPSHNCRKQHTDDDAQDGGQ